MKSIVLCGITLAAVAVLGISGVSANQPPARIRGGSTAAAPRQAPPASN